MVVGIRFQDHQVIIPLDTAVLVLTRAQCIDALKRGKVWRRQAMPAR
jgi:hypothetical protein